MPILTYHEVDEGPVGNFVNLAGQVCHVLPGPGGPLAALLDDGHHFGHSLPPVGGGRKAARVLSSFLLLFSKLHRNGLDNV